MNEDQTYTFCGYQHGTFTSDSGELVPFCNIYVLSKFEGKQTTSFQFGGFKAEKLKCTSPDVFAGIEPQDKVILYFNQYGRVKGIEKVK